MYQFPISICQKSPLSRDTSIKIVQSSLINSNTPSIELKVATFNKKACLVVYCSLLAIFSTEGLEKLEM